MPSRIPPALATLTMLAGCASATPAPTGDFCRIYEPIFDSIRDTPETRAQVLRENAKFDCVCNRDCPGDGIERD